MASSNLHLHSSRESKNIGQEANDPTEEENAHPSFGVEARVDDAVHVQVEIVEFEAVRVRLGEIQGKGGTAHALSGLLLDHVRDRERVAIGEPSVKGRNSHTSSSSLWLALVSENSRSPFRSRRLERTGEEEAKKRKSRMDESAEPRQPDRTERIICYFLC
ncbi:hypothetical protein BHE74_00035410 [Ensete ventricosum]|nr:hypothetical protein GW17_00000199 [Ensete ventricosum]RWW57769.1 hypothetical protein BHE74_00035410 [Ensete ventricosum]RZR76102.1 hypothetical protein BHM03_00000724 [Ensete ventricosum]